MGREHLTQPEAAKYVAELEQAREAFFRKFFKVQPADPTLYHVMVNMGKLSPEQATEVILQAVQAR